MQNLKEWMVKRRGIERNSVRTLTLYFIPSLHVHHIHWVAVAKCARAARVPCPWAPASPALVALRVTRLPELKGQPN